MMIEVMVIFGGCPYLLCGSPPNREFQYRVPIGNPDMADTYILCGYFYFIY